MDNTELQRAAQAAGLLDMDMLALADATLPPREAIRKLQDAHPAAFAIPRAAALSREQYAAAKADMLRRARRV